MKTKDRVLKALEEKKGSFISGEELAKAIGVSRNSVWKSVRDLKELGYSIDSVTNKGYRLSKTSDILSVQGIAAYLHNKEDMSCIEVYEKIDSTSRLAKKQVVLENSGRHVIIAKVQTNGKGHGSRHFDSPEGGVYFSVIISPEDMQYFNLPLYAAVAVSDALGKTKNHLKIKWINDIYYQDKKICGILTENISDMETGEISSYIIGIGINCKIDSKNELIADILNRLFYPAVYYPDSDILDIYQSRLLDLNNRVKFAVKGDKKEEFCAVILGLDEEGNLIVREDDGTKRYLKKGEIVI